MFHLFHLYKKPYLPNKNPFQENLAGFITNMIGVRKNFSHTKTPSFFSGFFWFVNHPPHLPPTENFTLPIQLPQPPPPRPFSPYRVPSLALALVPCDMSEDLARAPARSASHGRTWEPRGGGEVTWPGGEGADRMRLGWLPPFWQCGGGWWDFFLEHPGWLELQMFGCWHKAHVFRRCHQLLKSWKDIKLSYVNSS